ncbi:MAG: hypothetical protein K8F25_06915, partial [Fimbriimonadaceae bacterium]|nr:hypothetical protein [Alphaproteobacteria bacterium]
SPLPADGGKNAALALFAWRAPMLRQGGIFAPISREGALVLNNLFLATATAAVLIGTLYPLLLEGITGDKISVGAPFFNMTFGPLMIPLLVLVPFGPMLAWKRGDLLAVAQRLMGVAALALLVALAVLWVTKGEPVLAAFGVGLAFWLIGGAIFEVCWRIKIFRAPVAENIRRVKGLPRSAFGAMLGHAGLGVMLLGIVAVTAWKTEIITVMSPGETLAVAGRDVTFDSVTARMGPNYSEDVGRFTVRENGKLVAELESAKRLYTVRQQPTTEAGIKSFLSGDLYVVLGDPSGEGKHVVRIYDNPLVTLIWIGAYIMIIGGAFSLSDRRLRVGAPRRARHVSAVPAE